jgi:hypothetical protein
MPPTHQASVKIEGKGSHGSSIDDAQMKVQSELDLVHWHMIRGDGLRASLVNRAGSVLSTNGLIVAGVALAVGFRNQHPNLAALTAALGALACIAVSVLNASMVIVTLRPWRRHFKETNTPPPFLYSYAGMHGDFGEFKKEILSQSPEELLEHALVELWRAGNLWNYRYRKLRIALRWLLGALAFLIVAIAISII